MTDPVLSTIGRSGVSALWIFGVPFMRGEMLAVGKRSLHAAVVIFPDCARGLRSALSAFFFFLLPPLGFCSIFHVFLSTNKTVICVSYVSVSMTTVILPLSAGMIVMVFSFFRVFMAFLSSFVMLLLGNFACLRIPATVLRSSAFLPWSCILLQANSVVSINSL